MKKIFIKISKIGFILCGLAMLAFVLIIQLQKKEIMVIPETVGTLFFIILCIATIAFAIAFIMDLGEEIKTNGWFLVLRNIGRLISTVKPTYRTAYALVRYIASKPFTKTVSSSIENEDEESFIKTIFEKIKEFFYT